ncbi:MAG: DUF4339 domain-containing protein [Verrucomicrobiota bacterium]|jgi:hypothetical protein
MNIHLCHQGRQLGEFSKDQVEAMLKAGVITDSTLAWTTGLVEWKGLREILGPVTPPPVPPAITTDHDSHSASNGPSSSMPEKVAFHRYPPPIMENVAVGIVLDEAPEIQAGDAEVLRPVLQKMRTISANSAEYTECVPQLMDIGDHLPEATGEFGTSSNNPIPVNGPAGLFVYLNTLRSDRGRPFAQGYQGTVVNQLNNRIVDAFFLQELTDQSPREFFLFFYLYSTRRSRKLPAFCYRVPMEPGVPDSSWQLGYKQPFMLKLAAIIPLLGVGNATYGAAGVLRREDGRWISFINADPMISKKTKWGFRVGFDNLHAIALITEWAKNYRDGTHVLKDEGRLRKLSADDAENYWALTFGRDGEIKHMGSGSTPEDPIVLWPMNNVAAAVIERGLLEAIFGKEKIDWIGEERKYPGDSILEYHIRLKSGDKRAVYFDLSRLNEKVDNAINRKSNPIVEKALGALPNSVAPKNEGCPMYLVGSEMWARVLAPGKLDTSQTSSAQQPLMTREQWQRRVREAEIAVEALEKQHGHNLPEWRENLRLMKLNPPKEFAPSVRLSFKLRVAMWFFPATQEALDRVIINDWKAGNPPQLPPACVSSQTSQDSMLNFCAKPPVLGSGPASPARTI